MTYKTIGVIRWVGARRCEGREGKESEEARQGEGAGLVGRKYFGERMFSSWFSLS